MPPRSARTKRTVTNDSSASVEREDVSMVTAEAPRPVKNNDIVDNCNDATSSSNFRILIATDCHVGYEERDTVRGKDSFETLEEILSLASEHAVDLLLLGGDLFHDNKPSRSCIYRTMELLRKYCLNEKPVRFQIVSDQLINFPGTGIVNFQDPNFNVGLPVFSIHGNHDDPAGDGQLAALDVLSSARLVNYFGRQDDPDTIAIHPVLLMKNDVKLALYGLGNIRDERLNESLDKGKVSFIKPAPFVVPSPSGDYVAQPESWYNLFAIHQNRVHHSPKNFVDPSKIDSDMDMVIWGHEHECLIDPFEDGHGFHIIQPGSSVATSLSAGEAVKKQVVILELGYVGKNVDISMSKPKWKTEAIPLKTVRPFFFESIRLYDVAEAEDLDPKDPKLEDKLSRFLSGRVEKILKHIRRYGNTSSDHLTEVDGGDDRYADASVAVDTRLPLVRIRVEWTGFTTCNPQRFGQQFVGKVANPGDILLFSKQKAAPVSRQRLGNDVRIREINLDPSVMIGGADQRTRIEDLIVHQLTKDMTLLPASEFRGALMKFVDKDEKDSITAFVQRALSKSRKLLIEANDTELRRLQDKGKELKNKKKHDANAAALEAESLVGKKVKRGARSTLPTVVETIEVEDASVGIDGEFSELHIANFLMGKKHENGELAIPIEELDNDSDDGPGRPSKRVQGGSKNVVYASSSDDDISKYRGRDSDSGDSSDVSEEKTVPSGRGRGRGRGRGAVSKTTKSAARPAATSKSRSAPAIKKSSKKSVVIEDSANESEDEVRPSYDSDDTDEGRRRPKTKSNVSKKRNMSNSDDDDDGVCRSRKSAQGKATSSRNKGKVASIDDISEDEAPEMSLVSTVATTGSSKPRDWGNVQRRR